MKSIQNTLSSPVQIEVTGTPSGFDALFLTQVIGKGINTGVFVARDDIHMARMAEALNFFAPHIEQLKFPAWD